MHDASSIDFATFIGDQLTRIIKDRQCSYALIQEHAGRSNEEGITIGSEESSSLPSLVITTSNSMAGSNNSHLFKIVKHYLFVITKILLVDFGWSYY